MPDYRIERLSLDSEWCDQIGRVVGEAFGLGRSPHAVLDWIAATTKSQAEHTSTYFGAIQDNKLIGFNAFIAHALEFRGTETGSGSLPEGGHVPPFRISEKQSFRPLRGRVTFLCWPKEKSPKEMA